MTITFAPTHALNGLQRSLGNNGEEVLVDKAYATPDGESFLSCHQTQLFVAPLSFDPLNDDFPIGLLRVSVALMHAEANLGGEGATAILAPKKVLRSG